VTDTTKGLREMSLQIDTLVLGPFQTNCYVLRYDGVCWVVDAGMWPKSLIGFLTDATLSPETILLTHGHGDHIAGAAKLIQQFSSAKLLCPANDAEMLSDPQANLSKMFGLSVSAPPPDALVEPGQTLSLGRLEWQVLDTSGHTPGGVSYYCYDEQVVFTGDALFAGSIGRTDIPGASTEQLLRNIHQNLLTLPETTRVLPGHGPASTIGQERRGNPFLSLT